MQVLIHKTEFQKTPGVHTIKMVQGAEVVSTAFQYRGTLSVWFKFDEDKAGLEKETRHFAIAWTGHPINYDDKRFDLVFIGTAVNSNAEWGDNIVCHIFELKEKTDGQ